jgi:hypothetical protein
MATASRPRVDAETVERIDALLTRMNRRPEYMNFEHKIQTLLDEAEPEIRDNALAGEYD